MADARRGILMLTARDGASRRQVVAELAGRAAPLRQRAADRGVELRLGPRIEEDPLVTVGRETGRDIEPAGALIEVTAEPGTADEAILGVVEGFGNWFGGVFEGASSRVALGTVHVVTSGSEGPVVLALGTRRRPGLGPEAFRTHWATVHAPLALSMMPAGGTERIGYQQLHVDAAPSARAVEVAALGVADLDGILEVRCAQPEDFLSIAAEPDFARRILEDERKFVAEGPMIGGFFELGR